MQEPTIRVATAADLPRLVESLGQERFFAERLERQGDGRGVLLVAWLDDLPVGDVYLWLDPADEPEVRQRLPGVPLLQHFEVRPDLQSRGIGSALLQVAEDHLRTHRYARVALGVEIDNHGAIRLYYRHGYARWQYPPITISYDEVLPNGHRSRRSEICHILVKGL